MWTFQVISWELGYRDRIHLLASSLFQKWGMADLAIVSQPYQCDMDLNTTSTWQDVPLARYVKLRVPHAPGMRGKFSPTQRVSDPDMHRGTCVTHVPWCMQGSLTSGFLWSRWRGKCAIHNLTHLARGPLLWFFIINLNAVNTRK